MNILINKYTTLKNLKAEYEQKLREMKNEIYNLEKEIRTKCNHTSVTHCITDNCYDRDSHSYYCNLCSLNLHSDDYNYQNITDTIYN